MGDNSVFKESDAMIPRILSVSCLLALGAATAASGQVKINEIRIEQPGPDVDEFVELKGPPGTNLTGYFYLVIGNDDFEFPPAQNGSLEEVIALSGTIPASGVFVIAKPTFSLGTANLVVPFSFEGGNNKTHLLVQGFTGSVGDDLDTDDNGVLDAPVPWSSESDSIALIQFPNPDGFLGDFVYSTTTIGPDAGVIPAHVWRCGDTEAWRLGLFVVGLTDSPGSENDLCKGKQAPIRISEIRIDQTGVDNEEYFELSGEPGASLDGYTYLVIGDGATAAGSGVVECVVPLTGFSINASGLFLCAENGNVFGAIPDLITAGGIGGNVLNFENSDNVTHLIVRGWSGTNGADLDSNNDGVLDTTPWTELVDSVSAIIVPLTPGQVPPMNVEWYYGETVLGPDGQFAPGHIYRCQPNGDWQIGVFDPASPVASDTPGSANVNCEACGIIGTGNCFVPHPNGGCEDGTCCDLVCNADPTCCNEVWDAACVTAAQSLCHTPGSPPALKISEVRIDQPGFDTDEYVEISGAPGTSLNGVSYVVVGRSNALAWGVTESVTKLTGSSIPPSGRFVFAKPSFTLAPANLVVASNGFTFNSDSSKTHLLVWNVETIRGEDLDADDDCTLDRPGWVSIIDQVVFKGPDDSDCIYGSPELGPDCNDFPPGHLFRCLRTDDWTVGSFGSFDLDTPGAANASCDAQAPLACGDACAGDCLTAHGGRACSNRTCCETVCNFLPECCDIGWDSTCADFAALTSACSAAAAPVVINEIRIDQPGEDLSEYFELKGAPLTSLDDLTYIVIGDGAGAAASGVIEVVVSLAGQSINGSGFLLVTEPTFKLSGTVDLVVPGTNGINFENADNVTHLIVRNFTGALNDDLDLENDGVLDSTPWDAIVDSIALVNTTQPAPSSGADWWYGPRIGPDGGGTPGQIYRCWPQGYWQLGTFEVLGGVDSPGAVNPTCAGYVACTSGPDRNGDGCVNGGDLAAVLGNWDPSGANGNGYGFGDANCDGVVNGGDLALVLGQWQPICP